MKPPDPPLLLVSRTLTYLLFWPSIVLSSCALGVFAAFWLETSRGILLATALALLAGSAIMFRAVRSFKYRTDPEFCERAAVTAVLIGSTASYIIVGSFVLGHADRAWQPTWWELAIAGLAQATAIAAYRWSLRSED